MEMWKQRVVRAVPYDVIEISNECTGQDFLNKVNVRKKFHFD